ncbi:NAD(P)-binding domain-containing protein [Rhodococcus wratislaviensis]|uniref:NAD(P)-binding domain-containing protein n=1 Tax=Rhodococcus wratislaviensis TaxID=44752 RepID=UPI003646ABCA
MTSLSILGTGAMGSAIALTLQEAGHEVGVWNRKLERSLLLKDRVAHVHHTAAEAVDAADLVLICVSSYEVATAVLGPHLDLLQDCGVIALMSGTAAEAVTLSALVKNAGGDYLDGAIEGYPNDIGRDQTLIDFSGSSQLWATHGAVMRAIAGSAAFVGTDPGAANVLGVAYAGAFYTTALGAFFEAFAYAREQGVSADDFEGLIDYWTNLLNSELHASMTYIKSGDFTSDHATLDVYAEAVQAWHEAMVNAGQFATLMGATRESLTRAQALGFGNRALSAQVLTAVNPKGA